MKKNLIRFFRNKYAAASTLFLLWVCFFNDIDLFYIIESRIDLMALTKEVKNLEKENKAAAEALHNLSSSQATLEEFARETYYMKRDNEDIFVFKEVEDRLH